MTKIKMSHLEMMKFIIILTGPIEAGKSTVARELIASSSGPIAYIEGDTFWSFIANGLEIQSRNKNFRMIMNAMTAASLPYAIAGYEVILDFSIPPGSSLTFPTSSCRSAGSGYLSRFPFHYAARGIA
jgi:hypothetical protein